MTSYQSSRESHYGTGDEHGARDRVGAAVMKTMEEKLSTINARLLLQRALRQSKLDVDGMTANDLRNALPQLTKSLRIFMDEAAHAPLLARLWALAGGAPMASSVRVQIDTEDDLNRARHLARTLCLEAGGASFTAQRVATAVSELARNIVKYTPGGEIELSVRLSPSIFFMRASDRGSGIENLDAILAGRYRSRTGMGLGILGTKRLVDRFDITTGANGTLIEAEVRL